VADSVNLIDMFVRGVAVGAVLALSSAAALSGLSRQARLVSLAFGISTAAWIGTESDALWAAMGQPWLPMFLACPVGAFFWLFVYTVFEDRPVRPVHVAPVAVLWLTGVFMLPAPAEAETWLWAGRNAFSGLLSLHALYIIARGWRGDLLEARRRLRTPVLGLGAVFSVVMVTLALGNRIHPIAALRFIDVGEVGGGAIMALLTLAAAAVFLQARPEVFGQSRRAEPMADGRAESADRLVLHALETAMAAESWRREGLTIGALASDLGVPEHRLRRLINGRLGHRNFAEFVNSHRIKAACRRLADPAEAQTTIAAIAFDLGYGSLGPFNRAFRAATGASPTEWRRQALASVSPELKEAV
jgi:AraC-like DNA-binding protein